MTKIRPKTQLMLPAGGTGTTYLDDTGSFSTPAGGGGGGSAGGLVLVASTTLGAAAAFVDFPSIASTYGHLRLIIRARGDAAATAVSVGLQFNGDTGANYDDLRAYHQATTQGVSYDVAATTMTIGYVTAASAAATNATGTIIAEIPGYAATSFWKSLTSIAGYKAATVTPPTDSFDQWIGHWRSTSAINRLTLTPSSGNFAAGSSFTLYGLGSTSPAPASSFATFEKWGVD